MPINLMYRTPDMSKGKSIGAPMYNSREVEEFLTAAGEMRA